MQGDELADLQAACLQHSELPGRIVLLMHCCGVRTFVAGKTHYELTARGRLEITKLPAPQVGDPSPQKTFPF